MSYTFPHKTSSSFQKLSWPVDGRSTFVVSKTSSFDRFSIEESFFGNDNTDVSTSLDLSSFISLYLSFYLPTLHFSIDVLTFSFINSVYNYLFFTTIDIVSLSLYLHLLLSLSTFLSLPFFSFTSFSLSLSTYPPSFSFSCFALFLLQKTAQNFLLSSFQKILKCFLTFLRFDYTEDFSHFPIKKFQEVLTKCPREKNIMQHLCSGRLYKKW